MIEKETITKLKEALEKELARLPDEDAFGESNEESKEEIDLQIKMLSKAEKGEKVSIEDYLTFDDSEDYLIEIAFEQVDAFLSGESSELSDYL